MHRVKDAIKKPEKVVKELPNWALSALYGDRQLIRQKRMTKYFIPFDCAQPDHVWKLFVFGENESEAVVNLDVDSTIIGRESFCDVRLSSRNASRQHCVIQFRSLRGESGDGSRRVVPYIFDMASRSGTYVNDERAPAKSFVELEHGDRVSFGNGEESAVIMRLGGNTD